jgi:hypothetical protein
MLNAIKNRILLKEEFLESASIIFEDVVNNVDDLIFLEDSDTEESTPEMDETTEDNSTELDEDPTPMDDSNDVKGLTFDGVPSSGNITDEADDFLSVSVDLKTNTINDILPIPPRGASEAINDDVLNTRIDSGFDDASIDNTTKNTIDNNTEDNLDDDDLLNTKVDDNEESDPELSTESVYDMWDSYVRESTESEQVKKKAEEIVDKSKKNIEDMRDVGDKSRSVLKEDDDDKEDEAKKESFDELSDFTITHVNGKYFDDSKIDYDIEESVDDDFDIPLEESTERDFSDTYLSEDWKDTLKSVGGAIKKGAQKVTNYFKMKKSLRNLQMMDLPENRIITPGIHLIGSDTVIEPSQLNLEHALIENFRYDSYIEENAVTDYVRKKTEGISDLVKTFFPSAPSNEVIKAVENFQKKFNVKIVFLTNKSSHDSKLEKLLKKASIGSPAMMMAIDPDILSKLSSDIDANDANNLMFDRDLIANASMDPKNVSIIAVYPEWFSRFNIKNAEYMEVMLSHEYGHCKTFDKISESEWNDYAKKVQIITVTQSVANYIVPDKRQFNAAVQLRVYWQLKPEKLANEYGNVDIKQMAKMYFGDRALGNLYDDVKLENIFDLYPSEFKNISDLGSAYNSVGLKESVELTRKFHLRLFPSNYHPKINKLFNRIISGINAGIAIKQKVYNTAKKIENLKSSFRKNIPHAESVYDDFMLEAIAINNETPNNTNSGSEQSFDNTQVKNVQYDDENTVTKAVKSKVDEVNADSAPPDTDGIPLSDGDSSMANGGSKEELVKKLGNITKSLEDAKRAIIDHLS